MAYRPFIAMAGRSRRLERIRQTVRDAMPLRARRALAGLLAAHRAKSRARDDVEAAHRSLPDEDDRRRYVSMLQVAEARWRAGTFGNMGEPVPFPLASAAGTVWLRPGTSDVLAYRDVVVRDVYGTVPLREDAVILDFGGHIGLTSAMLLSRYPRARVFVVEPDPHNLALCRKNLAAFGSRAIVLHAAIWDRPGRMHLAAGTEGTWASHVEPGDGEIEAITVAMAFERLGIASVDLVKLDVEGAEQRILESDMSWLDRTRCLMLELESDEARAAFNRVMSRHREFELSQKMDVTIAVRVR